MNQRKEKDALGEVNVPSDKYWGAQTQRSLEHFRAGAGKDTWSREVIWALGVVKKAAALANRELDKLSPEQADLIVRAAEVVIEGKMDEHFPLVVWQTGSGTQTNMNANEVIANLANEMAGSALGTKTPIHPNDQVNMGQSSNDVFPAVMHLAALKTLSGSLIPSLEAMIATIGGLEIAHANVLKIGRTHLMDAVPITFGQELSGWRSALVGDLERIRSCMAKLGELALGGTAVGTGLNTHPEFGDRAAAAIGKMTGYVCVSSPNKFESLTLHNAVLAAHGHLRTTATSLIKIANDVRWMASGPHAGLSEIAIPANEPGSSIMPGKVNPTQAEALIMICYQVFGHDAAMSLANASGNFELNVAKPLMLHDFIASSKLLAEGIRGFTDFCLRGIKPNEKKLREYVAENLMLATALSPHIGYEKSARAVKMAEKENISLKEAVTALGFAKPEEFDRWADPAKMI